MSRVAPDHDVEHLLLLEQAAHGDAADQRRRGTTHVTWLEAMVPGLLEIHLDLDRLLLVLLLDLRVPDALDLRERLPDLLGLGAKNAKVLAVDAHRDCLILAGQALPHLLGEEGLHLAVDARLGTDDRPHRVQRVLVVGLGIDADPHLGRIDVGRLMRSSSARPICAAALRTPGIARRSRISAEVMRSIACREVPGGACNSTKTSVSLKDGISERSSCDQTRTQHQHRRPPRAA